MAHDPNNGTRETFGGVIPYIEALSATSQFTNSTTEAAFGTGVATIPLAQLQSSQRWKWKAWVWTESINAGDETQIKAYLGTISDLELLDSTSVVVTANDMFVLEGEISIRTLDGASSVVDCFSRGWTELGPALPVSYLPNQTGTDLSSGLTVSISCVHDAADPAGQSTLVDFYVQAVPTVA